MKTRSKTEVTVETRRIITLRKGSQYGLDGCEECGEQARMVPADEAAILVGVSPRVIYQMVEAHGVHFMETPDRAVFICLKSLGSLS